MHFIKIFVNVTCNKKVGSCVVIHEKKTKKNNDGVRRQSLQYKTACMHFKIMNYFPSYGHDPVDVGLAEPYYYFWCLFTFDILFTIFSFISILINWFTDVPSEHRTLCRTPVRNTLTDQLIFQLVLERITLICRVRSQELLIYMFFKRLTR